MLKKLSVVFFLSVILSLASIESVSAQSPIDYDCSVVTQIPVAECEAILALAENNIPGFALPGDWFSDPWPCSWSRIYCASPYNSITELELSNTRLKVLPPEIGNLSNLEEIYLHSNQLTSLPPEVGNWSNLIMITLHSNQLTSLPPEVGNWSNLFNPYGGNLDLSSNQLTSLPTEIGNLSRVRFLNLRSNQLTSLPPGIGNLSNLESLYLESNQLTSLPPEIGNLSSLWELSLQSNQLTSLPPEIGNLSSLTILSLQSNQLTSLPPEIGNLSSLWELSLQSNQLTSLSPEIGGLESLTALNLNNNLLTSLPIEISFIPLNNYLNLSNNLLVDLPLSIVLTSPSQLYIDNNPLCPTEKLVSSWINRYDDGNATQYLCQARFLFSKDADTSGISSPTIAVGDIITYTFEARSLTPVTVENVTVTDPIAGLGPLQCTPALGSSLAPGETMSCDAIYTASAEDAQNDYILNEASVSGTTTDGEFIEANASHAIADPTTVQLRGVDANSSLVSVTVTLSLVATLAVLTIRSYRVDRKS